MDSAKEKKSLVPVICNYFDKNLLIFESFFYNLICCHIPHAIVVTKITHKSQCSTLPPIYGHSLSLSKVVNCLSNTYNTYNQPLILLLTNTHKPCKTDCGQKHFPHNCLQVSCSRICFFLWLCWLLSSVAPCFAIVNNFDGSCFSFMSSHYSCFFHFVANT